MIVHTNINEGEYMGTFRITTWVMEWHKQFISILLITTEWLNIVKSVRTMLITAC